MSDQSLDAIVLGSAPSTGADWFFSPRQAEGLDDAEFEIVSAPSGDAHEAAAAEAPEGERS
jgi:hypothetical protein